MIELLPQKNYLRMPWKNGQGFTDEIFINPPGASLAKNDFDFRISRAHMSENNEFSLFQGYDRILASVTGKGFWLNNKSVSPSQVVRFPGEEKIFCKLESNKEVDLGLIFNRNQFRANFDLIEINDNRLHSLATKINFFYCLFGTLEIENKKILPGDSVRFEGPGQFSLNCQTKTKFFAIGLQPLSN